MNWFLLLKTLHIVSAITAVGANITYGAWAARSQREPDHLAFALRGIKFIDDRIANPAYGVLLLTGLLMAIFYLGFGHLWLLLGLGMFVLLAAIAVTVYSPALTGQIKALETDGVASQAYKSADARATAVGIFLGVVAIAVVFVMVFKPQI
jgi:hypothetical protein